MKSQSFADLEIYQKAHQLAIEIHTITFNLPKFELYEEGSQIRRSSKSIVINIVEGFGRRRYKYEFIQFLTFAFASCVETPEHLDLLFETKSLKDARTHQYFKTAYDELGRKIYNFIKAVEEGHKSIQFKHKVV